MISRWPVALAVGAGGGAVMALAFPPIGFGPYAALGVAMMTGACLQARMRRGLAVGFVGGLVFFAMLMPWLRVVGSDAWLLLSAFCALWFALVGAGTALVSRLPGWPVWVAALWTLQEALRGRIPLGGYPWGRLAFAQPDTALGHLAFLGGLPLVTFGTALAGTSGLAALLVAISRDRSRAIRGTAWLAVSLALLIGGYLLPLPATVSPGADRATIALVQGGTPSTGLGAMDVRRAVLEGHVRTSELLAARVASGDESQPEVVIWPENSTDIDPFADADAAAAISRAAAALRAPVLVGAVVMSTKADGTPGLLNSGVVWDPVTGPGERYVKTHPVPFGEVVPFRDLLTRLIGRFELVPYDFIAGSTPGNLTVNGVALGDIICFEVGYDDVVQALIDGGAEVLVVQTNNATYEGTAQPDQQLFIERMRAIETGRWVLVAATSGISAVIDPRGDVVSSIGQGDSGFIVWDTPQIASVSWANRIGPGLEIAICMIAAGALIAATVDAVRSRRARSLPV